MWPRATGSMDSNRGRPSGCRQGRGDEPGMARRVVVWAPWRTVAEGQPDQFSTALVTIAWAADAGGAPRREK